MSRKSRYIIGIDLGTTNTAMAYVERRRMQAPTVTPQPVAQRVSEHQVAERRTMPSFLYLPGEHELPQQALSLPWTDDVSTVVGEFARSQGARVPTRLVTSAKSWLCHPRADRSGPILPWDAPPDLARVSPVEASARYLAHLRDAWDHTFGRTARFREQEIVLCVPASFNEVARELTVRAASLAGLDDITLLEEPQAAFYAWLERHREQWLTELADARRILVCDIGGGTTDFTLIDVDQGTASSGSATPRLRRAAVGEHLMLGGDNMDLALAHVVEQALGARYDPRSWGVLVAECRSAKERLLAADAPEEYAVTIAGGGRRLLAGLASVPLPREDVRQIIVDGFFPFTPYDEDPTVARRSALSEWGLPYASDAAVSRHLARFLRHQGHIQDPTGIPDVVLFNGAALEPAVLRDRVLDLLGTWAGRRPRQLPHPDLDLAVARGAAWFGWVRQHGGLRIGGGMARAYYVGVAAGEAPRAACLIPRGLEEGHDIEIAEPEFRVVVDRPVAFPLYASSVRLGDEPGSIVDLDSGGDFEALPPLASVLGTKRSKRHSEEPAPDVEAPLDEPAEIPVHLRARVTEIGTLELWCVAKQAERTGEEESAATPQKWRLQFQVRGDQTVPQPSDRVVASPSEDPGAIRRATRLIVETFNVRPGKMESAPVRPRGLLWALEDALRARREEWSLGLLRDVWQALDRVKHRRRSSEAYEAPWLNATGWSLRPGLGFPLDDWRVNRTWEIFERGLQFSRTTNGRIEWWVLWRRIAGGLERERQQIVFEELMPHLLPGRKHHKTRLGPPTSSAEWTEVLRLAASLERLAVIHKLFLGKSAVERLDKRTGTLEYWMLARLGGRVPLSASPHHCVPPEVAAEWIGALLEQPWKEPRMAGFAVCQMGRLTGDRSRDLDEEVRAAAVRRLRNEQLDDLVRPLEEIVEMDDSEQAVVAGETLPVGLRIARP